MASSVNIKPKAGEPSDKGVAKQDVDVLEGETLIYTVTLTQGWQPKKLGFMGVGDGTDMAADTVTLMISDKRIVVLREEYNKHTVDSNVVNSACCGGLFSWCYSAGGLASKAVTVSKVSHCGDCCAS